MKLPIFTIVIGSVAASLLLGCFYHDPIVPVSDKSDSDQTFTTNESRVLLAITNAFAGARYREMNLESAIGFDFLVRGWHPTNGFILEPFSSDGSITNIPLVDSRLVPYKAFFYITTVPIEANRTKVIVRTVLSEVIDGKEPGVHGGWANHYRKVQPIRQEEKNVLDAISRELN